MTATTGYGLRDRMRHPPARPRGINPIDAHVGARIRLRRTLMRKSQDQLASDVGVSFQQVQKYENGCNRVSAGRLFHISRALRCPVGFFFDDMPTAPSSTAPILSDEILSEGHEADPMQRTETVELVRAYWRLTSPELRRAVLMLLSNAEKGK